MKCTRVLGHGLISAMAVLASLSAAPAADLYRHGLKDEPLPISPLISWTGFYLGGNLGASWPRDDLDFFTGGAKAIGGVHGGYNYQWPNNILLGIEGDADFSQNFDYLGSVRARLGYAYENTLIYGTGGVAFAGFAGPRFSDETGWVAGGGLERKLRDDLSIGLEGLYYSFDNAKFDAVDDSTGMWTARGRLTYHFGTERPPLK